MKEINNEKNFKLIAAKNAILEYLVREDFTLEECDKVFEMCVAEISAETKRRKFSEVRKGDDNG